MKNYLTQDARIEIRHDGMPLFFAALGEIFLFARNLFHRSRVDQTEIED